MNFSTDRDLLVMEPNVFNDVPLAAQQRLRAHDAVLAGTTLTSSASDFAAAQVEAGCVVLVNRVPYEVIARSDPHTLTISRPRAALADSAIPGDDGQDLELIARTFAPQAALVHDLLLRMIGVDPDDQESALSEDAVVSLGAMARLEALGTLERVYSAAAALSGDNEATLQKAELYRQRFRQACQRAVILLDTDGDGRADVRRQLAVINLVRS